MVEAVVGSSLSYSLNFLKCFPFLQYIFGKTKWSNPLVLFGLTVEPSSQAEKLARRHTAFLYSPPSAQFVTLS